MTFKSIANSIKKAEKIAIFGHISPDLDCFGSAFSLKQVLTTQLKKDVNVFVDGKIEDRYKKIFYPHDLDRFEFNHTDYDLIIVVDTPNKNRVGKYAEEIVKHKNVIRIDHHFDDKNELTKKYYLDKKSSSCSELIYEIIKLLVKKIDKLTATYLYAGLVGDTNSFKNNNVTTNSLKVAYEMSLLGADLHLINDIFFRSQNDSYWNVTKTIFDNAEFYGEFGISGMTLKQLKKVESDGEGNSRFATEIISLEKIKIGCIYTEQEPKKFYCSFRCISGFDVSKIAAKFGGGGHKCAAGCLIMGSYKEVKKKIIKEIKDYLNEVKSD